MSVFETLKGLISSRNVDGTLPPEHVSKGDESEIRNTPPAPPPKYSKKPGVYGGWRPDEGRLGKHPEDRGQTQFKKDTERPWGWD